MNERICFVAILILLALPSTGSAGPLTQDQCPGTIDGPTVWHQRPAVLENLLFADDGLWVSAGAQVVRLEASGAEGTGLTNGLSSAGGLALDALGAIDAGKAGWVYAGNHSGIVGALLGDDAAGVLRFDPADPNGTVEVYTSGGFSMANGMWMSRDGTIYTSNDVAPNALNPVGLVKIPANAPAEPFSNVYATNGLVEMGDNLYAAVTFDQRSPIARISLADPADNDVDIQLTFGVASLQPAVHPEDNDPAAPLLGVKGLDDMTSNDGLLYPVANGTGELLEVDPSDGSACLIAGGLQNPSSVRIAPESGGFADGDPNTLDFYITGFDGTIRTVLYTPA